MTEEIENNPAEETQSKNPVLIKRSKRATVRLSLRAERKRLKELEKEMSQGRDVIDDIDACKGEIELLFKELQSIEEGGHTTFLHAKELIAPKKNISSKKEFIRGEIRKTYTEIAELEEKLILPNMEDSERDSIILSISEKENTLSDLKEEMEALKNFNHTRYVSAREDNRKANELHTKLEQIEEQLNSLSDQLIEAAQNGNYDLIESLNEQALDLKKHKADLLQTDQESETSEISINQNKN